MALRLHERGLFTWPEWAAALSQEIGAARARGDADLGDTYYQHWLRALETMVERKGAASADELARYQPCMGRSRRAHAARIADRTAGGRLTIRHILPPRSGSQRRRHFRRIERGARPAAVVLPIELIGRPVVLVELQGDHVGLAVPADGLQAQRGAIGLAAAPP